MIDYAEAGTGIMKRLSSGIYVISRRKLNGLMDHYGVLVTGIGYFPKDEVFHLTDGGYAITSFEGFSHGHPITIHPGVPPAEALDVIQRAKAVAKERPLYDLVSHNCEHAANWVVHGRHESGQVDSVMAVLIGVAVVAGVCILAQAA
jgi:hypothetical protein